MVNDMERMIRVQRRVKVTIFCTSDIHGHVMPVNYGTKEKAHVGLAKYATVVQKMRKKHEHLLVLDNGDLIQGTPLMSHYVKEYAHQKNPIIHIMNKIGIDASVIGNHEFNFGKKVLSDAVEQSDFPWLSANIADAQTKESVFGPPYMIKRLTNGVKIAIIGVTTHYIPYWESPEHIQGLCFQDAYETLQTVVAYVREVEQPDLLIVSYHGGFERDLQTGEPTEALTGENQAYQMCQQIEGVDVMLTGHQHRQLTGFVNNVCVVQPGSHGRLYGEIQVHLDKQNGGWSVIEKNAHLHSLKNIEPHPEVLNDMKDLEASTQAWLDEVIGYIEGDMTIQDPLEARIVKHPFIQLMQNIQMEASGVDISVTALLNNDTIGFNTTVTMRDVVFNYMYPNTLVVLELTGKDIKAALEKSAEYFMLNDQHEIVVNRSYLYPKPQHYNYDMWEGIEYTIHVGRPLGSRIADVTYHGKRLKPDGTYHVVLNNYRASGGGNYDMFMNKRVIKVIPKDTVQLIREYFAKHQTVQADVTENYVVKR